MTSTRRMLITGGTSGIGAAIARGAAEAGHLAYITGRDADRVSAVAENPGVFGSAGDASDWESTADAVARAATEFGGLDVIVANAGFPR